MTGILQAFGTAWGLLRHYWVVFKLVLTLVATGVLLMKLSPVSELAATSLSESFAAGDALGLRTSLLLHAAGGLVVLLIALVLAVFKPAGLIDWRQGTKRVPVLDGFAQAPRWASVHVGAGGGASSATRDAGFG